MPGAITRKARISKKTPGRSQAQITALGNFARVSKVKSAGKDVIIQSCFPGDTASTDLRAPLSNSRKRRAASSSPSDSDDEIATLKRTSAPGAIAATTKRQCRRSGAAKDAASSTTEQAELLLGKLELQSPRPKARSYAAPLQEASTSVLPQTLRDLLDLHTAFLKTLTLHLAHNGTNAPVDLHDLYPSITQAWGKRKVSIDDIRHCLGIQGLRRTIGPKPSCTEPPFFLSDYGRGKICVELQDGVQHVTVSETRLKDDFESTLRELWSAHHDDGPSGANRFVASLPKAEIIPNRSGLVVLPNLANARRKFEELKNGVVKKQQAVELKAQAAPLHNPDGTKMSLLDRIRFKQTQQTQAPEPPTQEQIQRRAALHRVDDVAAVLAMLATASAAGQRRVSFTMTAVLQKLKDSLRVPIGREEGATCVRLLATDISPQWLRVVNVAGRENVVMQMDFQPSRSFIQERVKMVML